MLLFHDAEQTLVQIINLAFNKLDFVFLLQNAFFILFCYLTNTAGESSRKSTLLHFQTAFHLFRHCIQNSTKKNNFVILFRDKQVMCSF